MNRPRASLRFSGGRRRGTRLGWERLEDRRLPSTFGSLASSSITSTKDGSGVPWTFTIGQGGTVVYDQDRATNHSSSPYVFTGEQTLPGIQASTIVATVDAGGGLDVLALAGSESYVYENRYLRTSSLFAPNAWSGWQPISTSFVAQGLAAVGSNAGGPTVFAIGGDQHVYAASYLVSSNAASQGVWSSFSILEGILATTVDATPNPSGTISVAALTGPVSYVEAGQFTPSTPSNLTPRFSGWSTPGPFVGKALSSGIGSDGLAATYVTGFDNNLYETEYGSSGWSDYENLGMAGGSRITQVAETNANLDYSIFGISSTSGQVYINQYLPSNTNASYAWTGWHKLDVINAHDVTATTSVTGNPIAASSPLPGVSNDPAQLNLDLASATGNPSSPHSWTGWQAAHPYYPYPLTSITGPGGYPVVFTIGSDGSVYEDIQGAYASTPTSSSFGGFQKLDPIQATSIVVTKDPVARGIDVFALAGALSHVFEDRYVLTSGSNPPAYAWSGWKSLGDFVASSIDAVTGSSSLVGSTVATSGPLVVGIGGDGRVFTDNDLETSDGSGVYAWSGFSPIVGTASGPFTSVTATAFGSGYGVYALTGNLSFVYQAQSYSPGSAWTTWQSLGNFVATSVHASTSSSTLAPTNIPTVIAIGADGNPYKNLYLNTTTPNRWSGFTFVSTNLPGKAATLSVASPGLKVPVLSLTTGPVSSVYVDQPVANQVAGTVFSDSGWTPLGNFVAISSALTIDDFERSPMVLATGYDGQVYVNQSHDPGFVGAPYSWYGWVALGYVPAFR